jgi:hypothetical protein
MPGAAAVDPGPITLGQVVEHVSLFVADAALHRGVDAEHIADGLPERLGAVEHVERALLDIQSALDQLRQQRRGDDGVLRRAFPQPERMLDGGLRGGDLRLTFRASRATRTCRSNPRHPAPLAVLRHSHAFRLRCVSSGENRSGPPRLTPLARQTPGVGPARNAGLRRCGSLRSVDEHREVARGALGVSRLRRTTRAN